MPNWCENRVSISFDSLDEKKEFISRCLTFVKDRQDNTGYSLDFHKIRPLGLGEDEDGKPVWDYNIACELWGTKWEISDPVVSEEWVKDDSDLYIEMYFDTAWSPPEGIYNELNAMFDDSSISWFYDEPNMQFAGYLNNE
tara:strand:- start:11970 stop:12389 length:420 start_codon:yes stop_codon:yes gene_type:complete